MLFIALFVKTDTRHLVCRPTHLLAAMAHSGAQTTSSLSFFCSPSSKTRDTQMATRVTKKKRDCSQSIWRLAPALSRLRARLFPSNSSLPWGVCEWGLPMRIYYNSNMNLRLYGENCNPSRLRCLVIPRRDLSTKKTTPNIEI